MTREMRPYLHYFDFKSYRWTDLPLPSLKEGTAPTLGDTTRSNGPNYTTDWNELPVAW